MNEPSMSFAEWIRIEGLRDLLEPSPPPDDGNPYALWEPHLCQKVIETRGELSIHCDRRAVNGSTRCPDHGAKTKCFDPEGILYLTR